MLARLVLFIQHANRMRHIVCDLSDSTMFCDFISNDMVFGEKVAEHKVCFDFIYNLCIKHFPLYEEFSEILS